MQGIHTALVQRGQVIPITIECIVHTRALPQFIVTGLPKGTVIESRERILSALRSAGVRLPRGRVVLNLQPADLPKNSSLLDLPITLAVLQAIGRISSSQRIFAVGELSLNGSILARPEAIAVLNSALQVSNSYDAVYFPSTTPFLNQLGSGSVFEALRPVTSLSDILERRTAILAPGANEQAVIYTSNESIQWEWVPESVVQELSVMLAGRHHVLFFGAPGYGKTNAQGVLSELWPRESDNVWRRRALRASLLAHSAYLPPLVLASPTDTLRELFGYAQSESGYPGKIWQAHDGVLWAEELALWKSSVLDALRLSLEQVAQDVPGAGWQVPPSIVATLNPCPCGFAGEQRCRCDVAAVQRYQQRVAVPLLDRFQLIRRFSPPLTPAESVSAADIPLWRERIARAWQRQAARYDLGLPLRNQDYSWMQGTESALQLVAVWEERLSRWSPRRKLAWWRVLHTLSDLAENEQATTELALEAYTLVRPVQNWSQAM